MGNPFKRMSARVIDILGDDVVVLNTGAIIKGIFQEEYVETLNVSGTSPVLSCKTLDVEHLKRDDPLDIEGKIYLFMEPQPDSAGITRIVLGEP